MTSATEPKAKCRQQQVPHGWRLCPGLGPHATEPTCGGAYHAPLPTGRSCCGGGGSTGKPPRQWCHQILLPLSERLRGRARCPLSEPQPLLLLSGCRSLREGRLEREPACREQSGLRQGAEEKPRACSVVPASTTWVKPRGAACDQAGQGPSRRTAESGAPLSGPPLPETQERVTCSRTPGSRGGGGSCFLGGGGGAFLRSYASLLSRPAARPCPHAGWANPRRHSSAFLVGLPAWLVPGAKQGRTWKASARWQKRQLTPEPRRPVLPV